MTSTTSAQPSAWGPTSSHRNTGPPARRTADSRRGTVTPRSAAISRIVTAGSLAQNRSARGPAHVHRHRRPGERPAGRGGEEGDDVGDLTGLDQPLERVRGEDDLLEH